MGRLVISGGGHQCLLAACRRLVLGLVHHTDRASQYPAAADQAVLNAGAITGPTSRTADCFDHALAESFMATLKGELIDRRPWPTRRVARQAICEGIEIFYYRQRRHSAVGGHRSVTFEQLPREGEQVASSLSVHGSGSTSEITRASAAVVQMRSPIRSRQSALEIK